MNLQTGPLGTSFHRRRLFLDVGGVLKMLVHLEGLGFGVPFKGILEAVYKGPIVGF